MNDEPQCATALTSCISDAAMVEEPSPIHKPSQEQQFLPEMDPISAAASIAGLLTIAVQLVKGAYTVAQSAKDYNKDLTTMGDEIATLMGLLVALKGSFVSPYGGSNGESPELSPTPSTPSSSSQRSSFSNSSYEIVSFGRTQTYLSDQLCNELVACQSTMDDVAKLLSHAGPSSRRSSFTNVTKQMSWFLKKSDIAALTERLDRHKITFILILSSQGT